MSDHRLELLKALREHGQTIQKLASGGNVFDQPPQATQVNPQSNIAKNQQLRIMTSAGNGNDPQVNAFGGGGGQQMGGMGGVGAGTGLNGPQSSGSGNSSHTNGILGGVNNFLGTQSNFSAGGANLQAGTNAGQLNQAYSQAQQGIGQQQNFLNALTAQNGIQNQQDVYGRMNQMANGEGPNPAMAMLNQQTGQNVQNQAALMASARGAGANPGMVARLAAQQGAQTQQNAIAQGASLQAQQSQNAINNMAGIAQNQVNQQGQAVQGLNTAVQNQQNILQGANSAYNNANVGMQSNMNNVNAQISQGNQNAGNGLLGGIIGGIGSALGSIFAEGGEVGTADVGKGEYTSPQADASDAPTTQSSSSGGGGGTGKAGGVIGSVVGGVANAIGSLFDEGGQVPMGYALQAPAMGAPQPGGPGAAAPKSRAAQYMSAPVAVAPTGPTGPSAGALVAGQQSGGQALQSGIQGLADALFKSKKPEMSEGQKWAQVAADDDKRDQQTYNYMTSEQDRVYAPDERQPWDTQPRAQGGRIVPGQPEFPGRNTEANDKVPALLTPKEVVLPLSVTQSDDPANAAYDFMKALDQKKAQSGSPKKMADGGAAVPLPNYASDPIESIQLPPAQQGPQSFDDLPGTKFLKSAWENRPGNGTVFNTPEQQAAQPEAQQPMPEQAPGAAAPGAPPEAPGIAPQQPSMADQNAMDPTAQWMKTMGAGYGAQVGGMKNLANAEAKEAEAKGQVFADQAAAAKDLQAHFQQQMSDYNVERQNFMDDLRNERVNPRHFQESQTTGQKVATAIGLMLGGMSGGILGTGHNPALDFLNKQIDRDIASQQENIGIKKSLLQANLQHFGNMAQAVGMTRVMLNDMYSAQVGQAAMKFAGPQAQARAQMFIGDKESQNAMILGSLAAQKAQEKFSAKNPGAQMPGQDRDSQVQKQIQMFRMMGNKDRAEDLEKRWVPGVGVGGVPIPQEARSQMVAIKNVNDLMNDSLAFSQQHRGTLNPMDRARATTIQNQLLGAIKQAQHDGVYKPTEAEFIMGQIGGSPASFLANLSSVPKIKQLQAIKQQEFQNLTKTYNIHAQQLPQTNPMEGKTAVNAQGHRIMMRGGQWVPVGR
jgi:hypothetical protein